MKRTTFVVVAVVLALPVANGCSMSNRDKGAVIGATTGAAVGGVIGNQTGSTVRGAIIGAVVGGAGGAVIGHQMDQQAKELQYQLPDATVTRVGEGITVVFPEGLLFAFDSDVVTPAAQLNLKKFADSLVKYPKTKSIIVGHTDAQGTDTYNLGLSERRASAAAGFITAQGIERARLGTFGRGSHEPIADNGTEAGRQQNRRIEIAIVADEAFKRQVQSQ